MKIIGLIGQPGSGKTTVMRNFLKTLSGEGAVVKEGLVVYTIYSEAKTIVAGIYDEGVFSGTDRTAKSCGPKYREWLLDKVNDAEYGDWAFYFEGERFSNSKFFDFFVNECPDVTLHLLEADQETLNERNAARSNQNDKWRKGMATRMRNLRDAYPVKVVQQGFQLN
jgi:hypothetical protein